MAESTIGIKVADGSYYPVLERGFTGRKKLVLTTARDNQPRMQIDLYRGNGSSVSPAHYIGSLIIENIPEAAQGEPEIELSIGIDDEGQLSAEASDTSTGESQRFSTSLASRPESEELADSDLELEGDGSKGFEEPAAAVQRAARREEPGARRGPSLILLITFVVLGVLLVAAVAYFVYRSIQGPQAASPPVATAPAAVAQPKATPAVEPAAPAASTTTSTEAVTTARTDLSYLIKRGDTLWDLSSTYYRNPWLYPRLAKANGIKNPDLIFAGTRILIPAN